MPQVRKVVRFYEATHVDQKDKIVKIDGRYWVALLNKLEKLERLSYRKRVHLHSGTEYYGAAMRAIQPAQRYLYAGRLRDKGDWPDTFESGVVGDLDLPGRLVEPTYLVPFGNNNYCAVMTPRFGGIRMTALDSWLTAASGLTKTGNRIELRPILDGDVLAKLNQRAVGVTKMSVRVPPGTTIADATGGGEVGDAIRAATSATTDEMYAELTWSFGHAKGSQGWREKLLTAARWIGGQNWPSKATVSMLIPETDDQVETVRSEQHDLLRDRIAYSCSFPVADGEKPSESSVLTAMQEAIDRFNRERG